MARALLSLFGRNNFLLAADGIGSLGSNTPPVELPGKVRETLVRFCGHMDLCVVLFGRRTTRGWPNAHFAHELGRRLCIFGARALCALSGLP